MFNKHKREARTFGKLWRHDGHRIMVRLLERYGTADIKKAAALYGIMTGLGSEAGMAVAKEMTR